MTMTLSNAASWDTLDAELGRRLRTRATVRAAHDRDFSALDEVAFGLRRMRATLGFIASGLAPDDAVSCALVTRAYRWSVRVARELEAIEHLALDAVAEWSRFESFAPFALAFFDSVLAAPFAAAKPTPELTRLRREIDAVLAPMTVAVTSSALAA
jgi:hypothetical protein